MHYTAKPTFMFSKPPWGRVIYSYYKRVHGWFSFLPPGGDTGTCAQRQRDVIPAAMAADRDPDGAAGGTHGGKLLVAFWNCRVQWPLKFPIIL